VARAEYEHIVAKMKLSTALSRNVPAAADYSFDTGDSIYVYREIQKLWTGPHIVTRVENKGVWIQSNDRTPDKQFNISQCRPAPVSFVKNNVDPHSTLHSVVIQNRDPRARLFDQAKQNEISGLFNKGTFRIVRRADVIEEHKGTRPNVLPSRFVLAIKHEDDGSERLKARLVVGGHRDVEKGNILHDTATVRHGYIRLLVALETLFEYPVWIIDVDQAYLQAAEPLNRKIYIAPKDIIELKQDELLQVVKLLYGIAESGDYWGETVRSHLINDPALKGCQGDLATFYKTFQGRFMGASATYVDDIFRTGDDAFQNYMLLTGKLFRLKQPKFDNFRFAGCEVTTSFESRCIHQRSYVERLKLLPNNTSFSDFRSRRAQFAWIANSRPDIATVSSQCSSVTDATYGKEWIIALNDAMKYLQQSSSICLRYPKLDFATLCIVVCTDSSFANNNHLSAQ
jgi:Reverse transcriptase (RNA-dependent DNA polymerase)